MDSVEWEIHRINLLIDEILKRIEQEIEFVNYVGTSEHGKVMLHYHKSATSKCTYEIEAVNGACAGPSPHALLKKKLEDALRALNEKYPSSPLFEID
jgi:hypothetical protein